MAASGAGKVVTGCSGCLVFIFLAASVVSALLPSLTEGRVAADEAVIPQIISGSCCCLSGVGLLVGIALLAIGSRKTEGEGEV